MVSIRDFARDFGISYEAVRKQVKRYEEELRGHIHMQGRTQYLDDVAVAFLSERRAKPMMAIYDETSDRRIQELEQRNADLDQENRKLLKALNDAKDRIIELQGMQARLEASEASQKALTASRDEYKAAAEKEAQRAQDAQNRATQAETELAAYKALPWYKKVFGKG